MSSVLFMPLMCDYKKKTEWQAQRGTRGSLHLTQTITVFLIYDDEADIVEVTATNAAYLKDESDICLPSERPSSPNGSLKMGGWLERKCKHFLKSWFELAF